MEANQEQKTYVNTNMNLGLVSTWEINARIRIPIQSYDPNPMLSNGLMRGAVRPGSARIDQTSLYDDT